VTTVQTVTGPVDVNALGPTLVHEHISISYPGDNLDPTGKWDRTACVETALERMAGLSEHGIRTFVDPCPIDLGRDPELMLEVAERSGMHVVCTTGFYHEHIGIPYYWRVRSTEEICEFYLHEIENGIGTTGIKPGAIKIASNDPPGEHDRKVIAAAAMAAAASDLTVISHCENAAGGDVQQDILEQHGVDLGRCLIGHQGQAPDSRGHVAIAKRGSFVGFDRIGIEILVPDDHQADLIVALIDAGHAARVCLSQDHMCCLRSPRFPYPVPAEFAKVFDEVLPVALDQMYRRPHTYMFTDFWPRLEARGVDRAAWDSMLVDNPRRLFGG
jgi:phosphotriesterase-related protein